MIRAEPEESVFFITETDCGFYDAEETVECRASSLVGFKNRASTFKDCLF